MKKGIYVSPFMGGPGLISDEKTPIESRPYEKDTVTIDGIEVRNDPAAIAEQHARNRAAQAATFAAYNAQQEREKTGRFCPLHDPQAQSPCKTTCALYRENGCALKRNEPRDTAGKPCPFFGKCRPDCAMFSGSGCTL